MGTRVWTLRRGDAELGTVLAVTAHAERIDRLAEHIAAHGFYTFAATPAEADALCVVATFDVIVVLGDVGEADRRILLAKGPPLTERLLFLDDVDEPQMIELIRSRRPLR